ncbi:putative WD repeat and SOCS box-containing protein 1 [Hypsibius exemplaris]|uniref:WD repeat and SOCS box-containing protein 1 n=1 Tax=Hypsibius exemplaris TaxID=2072580 RepID=A0A1W0WDH8_HYPEX|nr:putative WD repeat and SOCS box-containing protein 1 [Hypsibius exemplaris]
MPSSQGHSDEDDDAGGLEMIRQIRSNDPIYRKISSAANEEVGRIAQGSKFGQEIMTCAFSPDGSLFAWSVGSSTVSVHSVSELLPILSSAATSSGATAASLLQNWAQTQSAAVLSARSQEANNGKIDLDNGQAVTAIAFGERGDGVSRRASINSYQRFNTKGNLVLAVGLAGGDIKVWDMATGRIALLLQDHSDAISSLEFSRDGSFILVSAAKDKSVNLWDLPDDGNMFHSLIPERGWVQPVRQVAWSPNGQHIVTVGDGKTALLWELETFTVVKSLQGHLNDVTGCRFSADGKLLYTSSLDTRVICWNIQTGQIVGRYEHMTPPPSAIFAAGTNDHEVIGLDVKQSRLATICNDGFLRVWDISSEEVKDPIARVEISPDARSLAFAPDERSIAIGCQGGFLQFYSFPE